MGGAAIVMKRPFYLLWKLGMILSIVLLLSISIRISEVAAQGKAVEREKLLATAAKDGFVKVIVRLDIPGIEKLIELSTKHKVIAPGQVFTEEGRRADLALANAIANITDRIMSRLRSADAPFKLNHTYSTVPLFALDISEKALLALEADHSVINIVEDLPVPLPDPPPDTSPKTVSIVKPMLNNTVNIIGANNAWTSGYTGSGWYAAILDTGIRRSHQFFTGKTIIEACFSARSDCPNGLTEMTGTGSAAHYGSTYQGFDHGTHVTGIAAGNYGGLYGVAKDANIIAAQVFSRFTALECSSVNPCVMSYTSDQIRGLEYIYSLRSTYSIASVNMSLGGGKYSNQSTCDNDYSNTKTAIDNLRSVNIATIIASGNDGYCDGIGAPACISTAIAVGATTDSDVETGFNNWYEALLDLFAPGASIYSSTGTSDTSYASWNGTSMATPHVTGAWAILRQKNSSASVTELLNAFTSTGVSVTTICSGQSGSKPRIKVDSALNSIGGSGISCSGNVVVLQNVTFTSGNTYNCVATTSITAGTGVTVQSGATVNFTAPTINLQPGFSVESGAVFNARQ
jgi:subtilisin family serine protease